MTTTIRYTNRTAIEEQLISYCNKLGITDSNYVAITLTLPHLAYSKQEEQLQQIINSIEFPFIGCLEFTDEVNKANGYHYHFVASNEFLEQTKQLEGVHISNNYISIFNWLNYIAKNTVGKQIVKYKPKPSQLEIEFDSPDVISKQQNEIEAHLTNYLKEMGIHTPANNQSPRNESKQPNKALWNRLISFITGIDQSKIFDG